MKKLLLVFLTVLLATGLVMMGCSGGGGGGGGRPGGGTPIDPGPGDSKDTYSSGNLAASGLSIDVPLNFWYNDDLVVPGQGWNGGPDVTVPDGYQASFSPNQLLGGHKITEEDEILLTVEFTSSRAANNIAFYFVDDSAEAGYWRQLTLRGIIGKEGDDFEAEDDFMVDDIAAGIETSKTYEYEIDFEAVRNATTTAAARNKLYINIDADHLTTYPNIDAANSSGDKITLNFTVLSVDVNGGSATPPPPPPPPPPPFDGVIYDGTWKVATTDLGDLDGDGLTVEFEAGIVTTAGFTDLVIELVGTNHFGWWGPQGQVDGPSLNTGWLDPIPGYAGNTITFDITGIGASIVKIVIQGGGSGGSPTIDNIVSITLISDGSGDGDDDDVIVTALGAPDVTDADKLGWFPDYDLFYDANYLVTHLTQKPYFEYCRITFEILS